MRAVRRHSAFTLIELLVVISILGILAALTVPAIKSFGKSNATVSATRQLLDDVARARQLAMSQRTTVYMVFVPTNFWNNTFYNASGTYTTWLNNLTTAQKIAMTNVLDKQLTGYAFVSLRTVGDQPGNPQARYLSRWRSLPDGMFIAREKFSAPGGTAISSQASPLYKFWNDDYAHPDNNKMLAFTNPVAVPFPTADSTRLYLPCIAFNYLGQLTLDGVNLADRDEYIPLARGSVSPAADGNRILQIGAADVSEIPPGNSTNIAYNIIHIDRLTGRARPEFHKVQ